MNLGRILALASLVFGVLFYLGAVSGIMWPASPPMDVGLVATSAVFVLFGVFGLMLRDPAQAPRA